MRATQTRPTGVERTFGVDEIIVTKTDPRGVITYANEVFLRTSALTEAEAIGQPHNLIRHPDMPRSVFKLLWDTLEQRQEIFAYVKNLAADGAHYWVFAHVTPSYTADGRFAGYHSNRRSPDKPVVTEVSRLYDRLLAAERGAPNTKAAVEAGWQAMLAELGDQTYDEYVWALTTGAR
ncbi:PAS domain-containing protein [Paractinoplanes atraurantiacus]|uniref:PAS domain S-box-containing protein n=1 Tax=Paractinoplanes atraurantiacus TaxID=1036182 RepID=A0A285FKN3_9ACTN|nr:PAS domain-containing protein [Actinoplanes atraurantiacus]SNY11765.1 PAS domain S-box-containing protein [Actinoplanes atraurantiacus]